MPHMGGVWERMIGIARCILGAFLMGGWGKAHVMVVSLEHDMLAGLERGAVTKTIENQADMEELAKTDTKRWPS